MMLSHSGTTLLPNAWLALPVNYWQRKPGASNL